MASEDDVRAASAQFYVALNRMVGGDSAAMDGIWSHDVAVTTLHPIGGRQTGWDAVRGSFAQVSQVATGGRVELRDQHIQVGGDLAYEIGIERGRATIGGERVEIEQRVTNIYRREDDGWRLVHHHSDVSPAMLEILSRMQAA